MSLQKIWAIAWKELYTTFRDRNLILIMFATPLVLSTIIGLAFGGLGGDTPTIGTIDVAVVNLDTGFDLDSVIGQTVDSGTVDGGTVISPTVSSGTAITGMPANFSINLGEIVAGILTGEALTASGGIGGGGIGGGGFTVTDTLSCALVDESSTDAPNQGSLDELLNATTLTDAATARQGVETGEYAVAVIIPPGFTQTVMPAFDVNADNGTTDGTWPQIEVYGNSGNALSASIVNSIVSGIVSQFARLPVTLEATVETLLDHIDLGTLDIEAVATLLNELRTATDQGDLGIVDTSLFSGTGTLTDTFAILGCLFTPGINPVTLQQQPLDSLQAGNSFARVLVVAGSAQAVFFALFTGVFGILSIYEERKQWTLQRILASPTTGNTLLLGKLLGNLVVVIAQLVILMVALTLVASIVLGEPTSIWGTNVGLLLLVVVALGLAVSGVGVVVVGLARTPEQVQIIGPLVNTMLGVFGSAFGFGLPEPLPRLSLITWGTGAFETLAGGQWDIGLNLLVLLAQGVLFFVIGAWFFRRRLNL